MLGTRHATGSNRRVGSLDLRSEKLVTVLDGTAQIKLRVRSSQVIRCKAEVELHLSVDRIREADIP